MKLNAQGECSTELLVRMSFRFNFYATVASYSKLHEAGPTAQNILGTVRIILTV